MFASLLFGAVVYGSDDCASLDYNSCMTAPTCWMGENGCSSECSDMGIPPPFNTWFSGCDQICSYPMLAVASNMFCARTCGLCPPTPPPTEPVFVKSNEACNRQEIQNEIEDKIWDFIADGNFDAVAPCLRMRSHLADILTMDDELVGTPDALLICGCLEFFDQEFAQEHLNCELAGEHIYDLSNECYDIGGYEGNSCDIADIESVIEEELPAEQAAVCADFATAVATYGTDAFDPTTICDCVHKFEPVFAATNLNCMIGGEHMMDLYTDICPAYENKCDLDSVETAITAEIESKGLEQQLTTPCQDMFDHFETVLDPITRMLKPGAYMDWALACQCVGGFSRRFADDNFRCGLAGHDGFHIWSQCVEHTPKCEDMTCAMCDARLRCSMSTDGTCKTSCPADQTCLDDPAVDLTCDDLRESGVLEDFGAAPLTE